jgi:hypothetical protein
MTKFPPHPAAALLPRPTDEEFAALEEDILANGLHDPIELFEGQVLDGITRQDICVKHDIDPSYTPLDKHCLGPHHCPFRYVASKNTRRSLTASQKAMVIAAMDEAIKGGKIPSLSESARIVGVDRKLVTEAKKIRANGSTATIEAAEQGKVSVSAACKLTEVVPDKDEQAKVVKAGKEEVKRRISGGTTFDVGEIEGAEAEPGKKPKNGAPLVSTKDRREAVALLDKFSRALQKIGLYEQFISPLSQIRERLVKK